MFFRNFYFAQTECDISDDFFQEMNSKIFMVVLKFPNEILVRSCTGFSRFVLPEKVGDKHNLKHNLFYQWKQFICGS